MYDDFLNQNNTNNQDSFNNQSSMTGTAAPGGQNAGNAAGTPAAGSRNMNTNGTNGGVYSGMYSSAYGTQNGSTSGAAGAGTGSQPSGSQTYGTQTNHTYNYSSRYPNNFTSAGDSSQRFKNAAGSTQTYGQSMNGQNINGQPQKPKKKKGGFKKVLACAGLGICFGVCAGVSFYAVDTITGRLSADDRLVTASGTEVEETEAENVQLSDNTQNQQNTVIDGSKITVVSDVSEVVEKAMPAMVSIVNTYTESFSYFGQDFSQEGNASGSGIIVGKSDSELLIVTNYHVIQDAENLAVSFVDNSVATAQVKGTDSGMDLAVIAIPLEDLTEETLNNIAVAELGDSDSLTLGEPAIAIGNALGYGQSVTTGVISALDREIAVSDSSSGTFIQTNAAINPGNSGGALLNIKGQVIGINSNKIGGSTIEGMGYAIPISSAKPIIEELMNRETKTKVEAENKGYLGITGVTVTDEVATVYGMPKGVYVTQVYRGTGAEQAGITKGSVITKLEGITISSMDDLIENLDYYAVGDTVEITMQQVVRQEDGSGGYAETTVEVVLGAKVE